MTIPLHPLAARGSRPLAVAAILLPLAAAVGAAQPTRATFAGDGRHVVLEALDDDLVRFEFGTGAPPDAAPPVTTSPMVARTDYPGAPGARRTVAGLETPEVRIAVAPGTLCLAVTDRRRRRELTTICPAAGEGGGAALTLARGPMQHVYGLGEQFVTPGETDGDWTGRERTPGVPTGNRMVNFEGGQVGNAQFPIMYAVGEAGLNYALFLDDPYAQTWDLRADPWRVRSRGATLRGYLMTGPDLPDLRRDYMELTGTPPVPPKQAFGLWVSEYGYEHWHELGTKLATLRERRFPVDGFVLDLFWFGGIITGSELSPMGSLTWDTKRFPDAAAHIARLRREHGVGIIPIEEPFISAGLAEHDTLARRGYLARRQAGGPPVYLDENPWWGLGGMLDFSHPEGAAFWHDWRRQPLVDLGVTGHWTDLGEPEQFDSTAWYHGFAEGRHDHASVHNLYNLAWSRSIADGYRRHGVRRRPLILSRSGTSGSQRYGVAMWSGDIGANAASLATHFNAQMHMAMSGLDYFGSDIGGFHRGTIRGDSLNELYTQWFAAGALLEVPIRTHTENLCNCKETAPDRIGDVASNLANLRERYALTPYYYSLAHQAHRSGDAVVAPPVLWFQGDTAVRTLGDHKLVGRDLLVAVVAEHGRRERDVYLPAGTWYDVRTNEPLEGGRWHRGVPLYRDGLFRLPLYARAGAILPRMHVDSLTMNLLGRRLDGSTRDELVARVYPSPTETRFTLFEDDGETVVYAEGAVATTELTQRMQGARATVTVAARQGTYDGAAASRPVVVELAAGDRAVRGVRMDGVALPRHASVAALEVAGSGWADAGDGVVVARSAARPVDRATRVQFDLDG